MLRKINQTAIWIFTLALIAWGGATAGAQRTFEPGRSSGRDRKVEATKTEPTKTPTRQAPIRQASNASEVRRHAGTLNEDAQYLLDAAKKTKFKSPKVRDQVLRSLGEFNDKSRSFRQQTTNRRGDFKNSSGSYNDTRKAFGSMQRH